MSQLVLITGCTRGLGRSLCDRFIEEDWTVIGCGRSAEGVASLKNRYAAPHRFDRVDVGDDEAVRTWSESVLATVGPPRLLLNNAALINQPRPLWEVPAEEFADLMRVNINGTFHVLRHFIPAMAASDGGVIVNFSSGWGRSTSPEVAPYCASKWAVEGLTQALAQELPDGLGAVALNPGVIDTDMLRTCWGSDAASFPDAETWSVRAVRFLMNLTPEENGRSLTVS